jgi:hypothetical protein
MLFSESKQSLARLLNINYANIANDALFSDADLGDYIQTGVNRAWDAYPWSFTEGAKRMTAAVDPSTGLLPVYIMYPETFEDESAKRLIITGKGEFEKISFADYQKFLDDNPLATDKLWADYNRRIFVNKNAYSIGDEVSIWGKIRAMTLTNANDTLPFSPDTDNEENSGNKAIVRLAYAGVLSSDKKKEYAQGSVEEKSALEMLAALWAPMGQRRAAEQPKDRPFFNVPDLFPRRGSGPTSRNIGNFP